MGLPPNTASDPIEEFMISRNLEEPTTTWLTNGNKKQCPECYGLHQESALHCTVCGWIPR